MLLRLPDAEFSLEELVLRGRFVDHVRHPGVPAFVVRWAFLSKRQLATEMGGSYHPGSIWEL